MTEQQQIWFDKLYQKRHNTATTLMDDFAISNMWNSVIEKYSDQAHFIYELLQNANDAKATKSSFQLTKNGLYFKHNGTKNFWVSNPDNEKIDQQNNKLGDINAITAVAQSNKKDHSTIGKFGVGFKAVFQYTETPHIYDPNFQFKIERFIVPAKLESDLEGEHKRKENETVFYFPFDKQETDENGNLKMSKERAYSDILEKLKKLVFPTLFLSDLQEVKWNADNETGEYTKKGNKQEQTNDITYEKIELYQQIGLNQTTEKLYLFSRSTEDNHSYSIGFFLDEKDKLTPKQYSAFCFFPTKETTNLNFILHAPFLLTDSREGIHRSKEHNTKMVELLSQLAAYSLLILKELELIDDDIIKIIPYKQPNENEFFKPFFKAIKEKFQTEELLPAKNEYAEKENAYWAEDNPVLNIFSDEQLALIIDKENAKWVFRSFVRNQTRKNEEIRDYIESCTNNWYEMSDLLKSIDADFIETQSDEWLHKLYEYLSKNNSYWSDIKTKPIFLNQERKAVPAFEQRGREFHEILFLPSENLNTTEKTINSELLKNEMTKDFIENFGIKQPSLKDEIYNHILPLYDTDEVIDTRPHFEIFFKYWKEEGRPEDFINFIKDKSFILYKTNDDETRFRGEASDIYYPTSDLENYFEPKSDTKFVDLEDYHGFITDENEQQLIKEFLLKLGVSELPRIKQIPILFEFQFKELNLHQESSFYNIDRNRIADKHVDGLKENLKYLKNNSDKFKSEIIWKFMSQISYNSLLKIPFYFVENKRQKYWRIGYFDSNDIFKLRQSKWLLSNNGEFVAPYEITINELADQYEKESYQAKQLIDLLHFKPIVVLTETERKLQILNEFENEGYDENRIRKLIEEDKAKQNATTSSIGNTRNSNNTGNDLDDENFEQPKTSKIEKTIKDLDDLQNEFTTKQKDKKKESQETEIKPEINFDENEELAKGIEDLKKQLEIKKSRVDLADSINNSIKYSYDWFIAYLQLLTTYGEKQDTQKQKSISFQNIKQYKLDNNQFFILSNANKYISTEIENAEDFKVSFIFKNGERKEIRVEGVSKKGQELLIYCRESLPQDILNRLSTIFKVEIKFIPVINLLDRLLNAFMYENNLDSWDNVQEKMPALDLIYGPPGTGKTTTLCNNINEDLSSNPNAKFLVLTPTNKAGDVVCKKLYKINENISAVRLSSPPDDDESIIKYVDSLDTKLLQSIQVVASTIHRLPYFKINGEKDGEQFSFNLFKYEHWDYVIFDEASMTGLHYITFAIMALFKTNPKTKFIVAGDPKQIPPVIEIDEKELENFDFQDENIYKMMNLESFNPKEQTIREKDSIQNLDTQYRSIPKIGQLFSELSYSSLLKHDRETNRNESKQLPGKFKNLISSNVTFVDIPLNQDNSIYRVNKLFYSSYHTYCAILVSEIIRYFDEINENEQWTIGLIAPYKAQAILLNKLITSYGISENVKVFSDTVHGFQGDECDIVFFVCNPNNYFYSGHEKALLSKEYIYNVAISRAKDYLIVLHPYTAIQNNNFINKIEHSYKNNFGNTKILNAKDIEKALFNDENFIENNSYVSGHDNVNVFGLSEIKYFIKANDTAIDIQLRDIKELKTNGLTVESNL